jgi:hypothetical protein
LVACLLVACGGSKIEPGPIASLTIASPQNSASLRGTQQVTVTVQGAVPQSVDLWVDGSSQMTTTVTPFAFAWNTDGLSEGPHELRVLGRLGSQNWLSDPITVNIDRTAPTVVSRSPTPASQNQDVAQPIVISFSEPMDPSSFTDASVVLTVNGSGTPTPSTRSFSENNAVLTITPNSPIVTPADCQVVLASTIGDLAGNPVVLPADAWTWSAPQWQQLANGPAIQGEFGSMTRSWTGDSYVFGSDTSGYGRLLVSELVADGWSALSSDQDDAQMSSIYPELAVAGSDGQVWVMVYADDGTARPFFQYWDGSTWSVISGPPSLTSSYSASGPILVVASPSGTLATIWNPAGDPHTEVQIWQNGSWSPLPLSSQGALQAAFEPDGSLLLVGSSGLEISSQRWNGTSWVELTTFLANSNVRDLSLTASPNQIALYWEEGNAIDLHIATLSGSTWTEVPRDGETISQDSGYPSVLSTSRGLVIAYWLETDDQQNETVIQRFDANSNTWLTLGSPIPSSTFGLSNSLLSDSSGRTVVVDPATGITYRWNE